MTKTNILKIFVTNLGKYVEGELVGEWLDLPATEDEIDELMERIGIGEEYEEVFITDFESDLNIKVGEYDNIEALNEMAEEIENLDEWELETLEALLTYFNDVDEALEKIENVRIWEGCDNMTEVAEQYAEETGLLDDVPEDLKPYFDYELYGRDLEIEGTFIFYNGDCYEVY